MTTLNYDCINRIIDLLHELYHVDRFRCVLENIPGKAIMTKLNRLINHFSNQIDEHEEYYFHTILGINWHGGPFSLLLLLTTSSDERKHMVKQLNLCNCCNRHKTKKPSVDDFMNGHNGWYAEEENIWHRECSCNCRHICRHICHTESIFQGHIAEATDVPTDENMVGVYEPMDEAIDESLDEDESSDDDDNSL